jgi:serine/threonine protein kinase
MSHNEFDFDDFSINTGLSVDNFTILANIKSGLTTDYWLVMDKSAQDNFLVIAALRSQFSTSESYMKRYRQCAEVVPTLHHPNIIKTLKASDLRGTPYLLMEYVPGWNLSEIIAKAGKLPTWFAVQVALRVCDGLSYLRKSCKRERPVLLPSQHLNTRKVMVSIHDQVKVLNLCWNDTAKVIKLPPLASLERAAYLPPELQENAESNLVGDAYGIGVLLYELLTGTLPVEIGESSGLPARFHQGLARPCDLIRPDVPPELIKIIDGATHRVRGQRQGSPDVLKEDLQRVLDALDSQRKQMSIQGYLQRLYPEAEKMQPGVPRAGGGSGGAEQRLNKRLTTAHNKLAMVGRSAPDSAPSEAAKASASADLFTSARRDPDPVTTGDEDLFSRSAAPAGRTNGASPASLFEAAPRSPLGADPFSAVERGDKPIPASMPTPQKGSSSVEIAQTLFDRGLANFRAKEYQLALDAWQEAAALDPNNRAFQANLKRLRRLVKQPD